MSDGTDRNLVAEIVFGEYDSVPADQRRSSVWVMAPDMMAWVRTLFPASLSPPSWPPPPRTGRHYILGLPVEIREGVDGIHLEQPAS